MGLTASAACKRIKLYCLASATILFHSFSFTQVYETKELKEKAEKEIRQKNKKLGISELKSNKTSIFFSISKNKGLPSKNTEREIFDVKNISSNAYKAVQFKVIDASNNHQSEKIKTIKNSIAKNTNLTDLIIDLDNNLFYRINKKTNEFKSNAFHKNEDIIQFDCKSCNYPPFKIEYFDNKNFNLYIPSEDEDNIGINIVYKFIKIKN